MGPHGFRDSVHQSDEIVLVRLLDTCLECIAGYKMMGKIIGFSHVEMPKRHAAWLDMIVIPIKTFQNRNIIFTLRSRNVLIEIA